MGQDLPHAFVEGETLWPQIREQLSRALTCEPATVMVFGSARWGYSLAPRKFGQPFHEDSDIDIAIIDADLFDTLWFSIIAWHYRRRHRLPPRERTWDDERRANLYWGYMEPHRFDYRGLRQRGVLRAARDQRVRWFNAFGELGLVPELARRKVTGRLYRTAQHAILYQESGLREARRVLHGS